MKKLLFGLLILLASCSKTNEKPDEGPAAPTTAPVRFYSTTAINAVKIINANIGAVNYGRVLYSSAVPECSAAGYGLVILKPGTYTVDYGEAGSPYASKQKTFSVSSSMTCVFINLP